MTRYIQTVRIQGFQSHADTTLQFTEGVNAITGPTDNGKSAVLRALQWWAWNKAPEGEWMRKGCTVASVEVTMSDGTVVVRERNNGRNKYVVRELGAEPVALVDFGRKPPREVLKAHGMRLVEFEKDAGMALNIATQLEAPFFLASPPYSGTMRAKMLSKLAGVEVIDRAIGNANKDILAHGRDVKATTEQLTAVEAQLKEYADLDEQRQRVEQARTALEDLEPLSRRLAQARLLQTRLAQIDGGVRDAEATLERTRYAEEASRLLAQTESLQVQRRTLAITHSRFASITNDLHTTRTTVERYANLPEAERSLTTLLQHADTITHLRRIAGVKNNIVAQWAKTKAEIERLKGTEMALESLGTLETLHTRQDRLTTLRAHLQTLDAHLTTADQIVRTASKRIGAEGPLHALTTTGEQHTNLTGLLARLRQADARISAERRSADQAERDLTTVSAEYGRMLQEAGVCPACGQPVTEHTAARIAAELHGEVFAHVG